MVLSYQGHWGTPKLASLLESSDQAAKQTPPVIAELRKILPELSQHSAKRAPFFITFLFEVPHHERLILVFVSNQDPIRDPRKIYAIESTGQNKARLLSNGELGKFRPVPYNEKTHVVSKSIESLTQAYPNIDIVYNIPSHLLRIAGGDACTIANTLATGLQAMGVINPVVFDPHSKKWQAAAERTPQAASPNLAPKY